jgi:hypothetical protein
MHTLKHTHTHIKDSPHTFLVALVLGFLGICGRGGLPVLVIHIILAVLLLARAHPEPGTWTNTGVGKINLGRYKDMS